MSNAMSEKPTIEALASEVCRLRERIEDLEDLMELRAAVEKNGDKPGIPWEQVRSEILDDA